MGVTRAYFNGLGNLHSVIMRLTKFVMGLVITGFVRCRILEETPSSPVAFLNPILSKYLDTLPSFTAENLYATCILSKKKHLLTLTLCACMPMRYKAGN